MKSIAELVEEGYTAEEASAWNDGFEAGQIQGMLDAAAAVEALVETGVIRGPES